MQIATEPSDLIIGDLTRRHALQRRILDKALKLAEQIEGTYAMRRDCPIGLADRLTWLADDLEDHQQKEEAVVFPRLLAHDQVGAQGLVRRMAHDHADLLKQLQAIRRLTGGFRAPPDACLAWGSLYILLARFDTDLRGSLRMEDDILLASAVKTAC